MFVVGESFEQTEKIDSGFCGEHVMAGKHFLDDESFASGNYGELFAIGENFKQADHVIVGYSGEHFMATRVSNTEDLNESFAFGNCKELFEAGEYSKQSKFSTHGR